MTATELNRDIKRLFTSERNLCNAKISQTEFFNKLELEIKPEFKRLYFADTSFKSLNKKSILILLRLNLKYRFIPLHGFGIMVELD